MKRVSPCASSSQVKKLVGSRSHKRNRRIIGGDPGVEYLKLGLDNNPGGTDNYLQHLLQSPL
jgi:hypothetical protein